MIYYGVKSAVFRERRRDVRVIEQPLPADEPLKLFDVREHLRIDPVSGEPSKDDPWIEAMIPVVREWVENWCERSMAPQTIEFRASGAYQSVLELPYGPVIEIVSVTAAGSALSDYDFNGSAISGALPTLSDGQVLTTVYRAGYGYSASPFSTPALPASILAAMKLLMGHFYENRESTTTTKLEQIPMGVVSLLEPYRSRTSFA